MQISERTIEILTYTPLKQVRHGGRSPGIDIHKVHFERSGVRKTGRHYDLKNRIGKVAYGSEASGEFADSRLDAGYGFS